MQTVLAHWENAGGKTTVTLELLEDGSLQVFFYDIGDDARRIHGDSDYEAWLTIPPDQMGKLAFALASEKLASRGDALTAMRSFCEAQGVRFEAGTWA